MTMPNAAMLAIAAMMANALSKPLTMVTVDGAWRGAGTAGPVIAARCAVGGEATRAEVPPVGRGGLGPVPGAGAAEAGAADAV